jgi:hypothetical protein
MLTLRRPKSPRRVAHCSGSRAALTQRAAGQRSRSGAGPPPERRRPRVEVRVAQGDAPPPHSLRSPSLLAGRLLLASVGAPALPRRPASPSAPAGSAPPTRRRAASIAQSTRLLLSSDLVSVPWIVGGIRSELGSLVGYFVRPQTSSSPSPGYIDVRAAHPAPACAALPKRAPASELRETTMYPIGQAGGAG